MTSLSRREMLALGAGSLVTLAGCSGSPVSGSSSVFEDVSFEGTDMVVRLRADHDVDRVNLVSPDGSLFASANVPVGTTTVRLQVLNISQFRPVHYRPGTHEVVAVQNGEEIERKTISLTPEVVIRKIVGHRNDDGRYNGGLTVYITNTGTAPTWVYDVVFINAPNSHANQELSDNIGIPQLAGLDSPKDALLPIGETRAFTALSQPLVYSVERDITECSFDDEFTVVVGSADGSSLSEEIRVASRGEATSRLFWGGYTCDEVSVELSSDGESQ